MKYQHITLEDVDGIATVTMCRAQRRNSLSEDHLRELLTAFQTVAEGDARGIVLAAEGPVFSSGHDFNDMFGRNLDEMKRLLGVCGEFMQLVQRLPQPVIAQVEGLATAAGCQLVASCDLAVAAARRQVLCLGDGLLALHGELVESHAGKPAHGLPACKLRKQIPRPAAYPRGTLRGVPSRPVRALVRGAERHERRGPTSMAHVEQDALLGISVLQRLLELADVLDRLVVHLEDHLTAAQSGIRKTGR